MQPFSISTKWFSIIVYRQGILFTMATVLLTSGITLCNPNLILSIISFFSNHYIQTDYNASLYVGIFLILVSLFLFYLIIINWRIERYSKLFIIVRVAIDAFGACWRVRKMGGNPDALKPLQQESYNTYKKAYNYISDNQTMFDAEIFDTALNLLNMLSSEIQYTSRYIGWLVDPEDNEYVTFNPDHANQDTEPFVNSIYRQFNLFVQLIKKKEKYRLK